MQWTGSSSEPNSHGRLREQSLQTSRITSSDFQSKRVFPISRLNYALYNNLCTLVNLSVHSGVASGDTEAMSKTQPTNPLQLVYGLASRCDTVIISVSVISSIVSGALMPLMTVVFGSVTTDIRDVSLGVSDGKTLSKSALYFVYLAIAEFVTSYVTSVGYTYTSEHLACQLRFQCLSSILRQGAASLEEKGSGEVTANLTSDVELFRDAISEKVGKLIAAVSTLVTAFLVGFLHSWQLTLMLSSTLLVFVTLGTLGSRATQKFASNASTFQARAMTVAEEAIGAAVTTIANCAQDKFAHKYCKELEKAYRPEIKMRLCTVFTMSLVQWIILLAYALAFWQGSGLFLDGSDSLGDIVTVLLAVLLGTFSLGLMAPNIQALYMGIAATKRIQALVDLEIQIDPLSETGLTPGTTKGQIVFDSVHFAYPKRSVMKILQNFSLTIQPGRVTALVGKSGSGKSTVVNLIERLYDPSSGVVSLDGHALSSLNIRWLRRQIAVVDQEPKLFKSSIFDNIADGLVGTEYEWAEASIKRDLVVQAAKIAYAHDFIEALHDQYQTMVGERGSLLSGGQRQRICIARAIVSDPKILILDEATSALDTLAESIIQTALTSAMQGRTSLVIAHRLSTIRDAHSIAVLKQGSLVEQGTFAELLNQKGVFFDLLSSSEITPEIEQNSVSATPDIDQKNPEYVSGVSPLGLMDADAELKEVLATATENSIVTQDRGSTRSILLFVAKTYAQDWTFLLLGIFWAVISGGGNTVQAVFFSQAINSFLQPTNNESRFREKVTFWALKMVMLAFVQAVAGIGQGIFLTVSSARIVMRARDMTFRHILRQNVSFFQQRNHSTGTFVSLIASDTATLANLGGLNLAAVVIGLTTIISGMIMACAVAWKLGLVCSATIPILLASGYLRASFHSQHQAKVRKSYLAAEDYASEAIRMIRTVAFLSKEHNVLGKFRSLLELRAQDNVTLILKLGVFYALSQALVFCCFALGIWYGSRLLTQGEYTMLQFFLCFSGVIFGAQSSGALFAVIPDMSRACDSARSIRSILEKQPTVDTWDSTGEVPNAVRGEVEFRAINFRYPSLEKSTTLTDINLHVQPGQYVGLVGPSGSGKSTILSLLERFYDPNGGMISLDNRDLRNLNVSWYRRQIALVSQETALFSGSIRDNLLIGAKADSVSQEQLEEAIQHAAIDEFISSLPDGLETQLGANGVTLSGGQRQRISIARALLRSPQLLLLDEATSSLDNQSEGLVQAALDRASHGRTTIVVAQRLSSISTADNIYVVNNGRIVESGNHQVLMNLGGLYSKMVDAQTTG
ncbi:hypothetical protein WAI453_007436 [Rhynchosporium graminicola]